MSIWEYIPPNGKLLEKMPYGSSCGGSYKLMFIVICAILVYAVFMAVRWPDKSRTSVDFLNHKVVDFDYFMSNCCSMWPITHFVFFFILGLLFPNCDVPIIIAGVLWEGAEETIAIIANSQNTRHVVTTGAGSIQYRDNWWAGNMQDIIFNTVGFYCGKLISKTFGTPHVPGLN